MAGKIKDNFTFLDLSGKPASVTAPEFNLLGVTIWLLLGVIWQRLQSLRWSQQVHCLGVC